MAERRMFSKLIIDSDAFLTMPASSQMLYFHLCMRADDDGFVNNPRTIQRMTCANDDDFKLLLAKRFILPFESGIIVIKHWRIHNYIQKDRYIETKYKEEKALLGIKENKAYTFLSESEDCVSLLEEDAKRNGKQKSDTERVQDVHVMDTQDSIDIDKDNKENNIYISLGAELDAIADTMGKEAKKKKNGTNIPPSYEEIAEYIKEKGYSVDADEFYAHYASNGWMVGKVKMKNWHMALVTWEKPNKKNKSAFSNGTKVKTTDRPYVNGGESSKPIVIM